MCFEIKTNNAPETRIIKTVNKTRNKESQYGKYIELGGSPRASIALFIASKAEALMQGRDYVLPSDIKNVAHDVLRHRLVLSFRAKAENINSDKIIDDILNITELP